MLAMLKRLGKQLRHVWPDTLLILHGPRLDDDHALLLRPLGWATDLSEGSRPRVEGHGRMIVAHKIALDLTQAHEAYGRKAAGTARFTSHGGLAQWQEPSRQGEPPTAAGLTKPWNGLKYQAYPWRVWVHR
jgi:hypothetical protein